ncbi:cyclic nucleotide-binding domain-containing protein [Kineothrix sedimenti]|uniref:Cyclic nucleotide-binding domain-containing protein n=1 Tax=Kineothrix sedimenti TaxID=3123317 RepID=A0ABZ3F0J6_9FIRM
MKKIPFTEEHRAILQVYGLQDISVNDCTCIRYEAGERVTEEGSLISRLALVTKGRAKICRTALNGKSLILCYYISEGVIGEIELLTGQSIATTTVVAISDFECVTVEYRKCMEELEKNLVFSNKIGAILARKMSESEENYVASALHSGEQRLCSYILKNSHRNYFSDVLSDVSCSIGMSYRHLFRLLDQLCKDDILEKRKNGYKIQKHGELVRRTHAEHLVKK